MQETDATMTLSRRVSRFEVAAAEAVDVVVSRAVLLDVEVGLRDVRLRLVVVVVGHEVSLDRVSGEELAKLVAELGGEGLVVRDHERRLLHPLDDPGHRRGLAGAGGAEQGLVTLARMSERAISSTARGWSPVGTYPARMS